METLGICIKRLRKEKPYKVYELADKVGVTPEYVTLIEKGQRYPSEEVLEKFMKALGYDLKPIYYNERYPDFVRYLRNKIVHCELTSKEKQAIQSLLNNPPPQK